MFMSQNILDFLFALYRPDSKRIMDAQKFSADANTRFATVIWFWFCTISSCKTFANPDPSGPATMDRCTWQFQGR